MKVYTLKKEQFVLRSLDEVFAFFQEPENLARITPKSLGFKILTPSPIRMKEGAVIDYTVSPMFFPMHWRTLITTYDPPHRLVDEQMKGPYLFWHHTHRFESVDRGTIIHDEIRYALPFGIFGRLAHRLLVRRQIEKIFKFRAEFIGDLFGGEIDSNSGSQFRGASS